jgi:membrane protein
MNFKYREFFTRLYEKISDDDILGNAAQVAFYFSFALFPLLLFLMSLLGLILSNKEELQQQLFVILSQVMPSSAFDLVETTLNEVTSKASGGKLTFGILITLWSASAGVDNMRGTLNEVYNLKETRSWFLAKLTSLVLTLVIGILILTALVSVVYGAQLLDAILPIDSHYILQPLEWIVTLVLVLLAFAVLYNFAPNHDALQWKWITPGAVVGVILWIAASGGFKLYLNYFDSYAATYGSLGAMIILLLWLYITALVILMGGAINAIFDEKTGIKKETEDPKQIQEEKSQSGKEAKTQ